jgi:hypothetical protein
MAKYVRKIAILRVAAIAAIALGAVLLLQGSVSNAGPSSTTDSGQLQPASTTDLPLGSTAYGEQP